MPDIRLSLSDSMMEEVDTARGQVPRVSWIRAVLEERLEEEHAATSAETLSVRPASPSITDEATGRVKMPSVPTSEGDPECKHWRKRMVNRTRVCIQCGKVFP